MISPPGSFSAGILPEGLIARNSGRVCSFFSSEMVWKLYAAPASASAASVLNAPEPGSP